MPAIKVSNFGKIIWFNSISKNRQMVAGSLFSKYQTTTNSTIIIIIKYCL